MEQHHDELIDCTDCGASFVFSAAEASVFAERGLAAPKRCKACRRARKERAASDGQSGHRHPGAAAYPGAAGQGNRHADHWNGGPAPRHDAPRRYTGDVNEYRSPMQDGFSGASGAPARGMAARGAAPIHQGGYAPRPAWQGSGEYRSPMPDGQFAMGAPPPNRQACRSGLTRHEPIGPWAARAPRAARDGNTRAVQDGARGHHARPSPRPGHDASRGAVPGVSREAPAGAASASSRRRPQAEMFAITCDACGAQAEVPFKPAEGREIYCPTCYRARRPST